MADDRIVTRKEMARRLRAIADDVEDECGEYQTADPDLRDTLLGLVDSLYCKSFPGEDDGEDEEDGE